jgi:hypothetical protein
MTHIYPQTGRRRQTRAAAGLRLSLGQYGRGDPAKRVEKLGVLGARKQEQAIAYSEAGISKKKSGDKRRTCPSPRVIRAVCLPTVAMTE